jgi:hypothetical protein
MAFKQQVTNSGNAVTITPTAAGNLLVGMVQVGSTATSLTVTDGGVGNVYGTPSTVEVIGGHAMMTFYTLSCASGATTLTVTPNVGGVGFILLDEYSGPYNAIQNTNGTGATITNPGLGSNAITTGTFNQTAQPALVWCILWDSNGTSPPATAGTNFTARAEFDEANDPFSWLPEDQTSSSTGNIAGTYTATSSSSGDTFAVIMLIFTQTPSNAVIAWIT